MYTTMKWLIGIVFFLNVGVLQLSAIDFLCPSQRTLFDDLLLVDCLNEQIDDRLPVIYNNLLYGGYINMPSARMGKE